MGATISNTTRRISFENTEPQKVVVLAGTTGQEAKRGDGDINVGAQEELDILNNALNPNTNIILGDSYWTSRLEKLQMDHKELNEIVETEFEKSVDKTNKLLIEPNISKDSNSSGLSQCDELRSKVLKCYNDNPDKPLACWHLVQEFHKSVSAINLEDK